MGDVVCTDHEEVPSGVPLQCLRNNVNVVEASIFDVTTSRRTVALSIPGWTFVKRVASLALGSTSIRLSLPAPRTILRRCREDGPSVT